MKGRVIKSTGSWYSIATDSGETFEARIRGKFRLKGIKHTNPIAVGDEVEFSLDKDNIAFIEKIYERHNYIIRRSVNLSKKTHIIASNIDVAVILATFKNPRTSTGFIDRFLVTAEAYHIHPVILFNKVDEITPEERPEFEALKKIYTDIGYQVLEISATENIGLNKVKDLLKDQTSVFMGHSGVGKSTLVNALNPELNLKTKTVSTFNQKGQHTTTFAQMYAWPFGGYIIDTPGIKEFGLADFEEDEIQNYFPELFKLKQDCKFHNCKHLNEPKCAVKEALEAGEIAPSRFESYLNFIAESNESSHTKS
ncbi:ribosome small subunit-dependent GTPase A [Ornithobacterium rhinotracheale]|uniref:Small ribosomal subunit biogenesis GTPase RsgA n=1 Tax=Ornithobacterium rhinotracheale (strain ATCC 51463 / DSM 15997 / CCUG 23171 / CIP 104009 / LMG 9086) TaxID=867902 RepID=I4A022_ORNRL|nr:ribosome small subunit-dependent GTPase A [Ornithobacterium rhinotracheale]AFL97306.1 ribosome small subunit-dependent GTPase A [Ornithobacterium rhinotracheale DSM 15997]AIP99358.1 GTPase RsgA [Ornithobacterium rhinotracheale ORT-UMN 88]KGB67161.1 GTPase RsgA [Ornithobacterium rhinotracheale H06-030791]MCK0194197.1 ribosome small subunit-dependent GTPase A [Ornithobacterium rhinotracheale]MCK0199750.1 ribosome small subunit-dependent GTPase A [Ornithobacterium rhinotracheale]